MLNKTILMGRLVRDPELKTTANGVSLTTITLAVDRDFTAKGAERQTDFIDIIAWRQTAEFICKWFHKGSMIAVEGKLETRDYTDKQGQKRKATEIRAESVYFAGGKSDNTPTATPRPVTLTDVDAGDDADGDLPF